MNDLYPETCKTKGCNSSNLWEPTEWCRGCWGDAIMELREMENKVRRNEK